MLGTMPCGRLDPGSLSFLHSSDPKLVLVTNFFCFVVLVTSCKVIKLYFVVVLFASNLKQLTVKNSIEENIL